MFFLKLFFIFHTASIFTKILLNFKSPKKIQINQITHNPVMFNPSSPNAKTRHSQRNNLQRKPNLQSSAFDVVFDGGAVVVDAVLAVDECEECEECEECDACPSVDDDDDTGLTVVVVVVVVV
jgi:hypothetical protein